MNESKKRESQSKKEELQGNLNRLQMELDGLIHAQESTYDRNLERELSDKMRQTFHEIDKVRGEIYLLENDSIASNEKLDIYLESGSIEEENAEFGIFLHGTALRIGRVTLRSNVYNTLGNVGYGLDEEYRGHRFMLQSLELLKETMIKMKIPKPIFTVEPDNEPSIHTIQNFGGVLIQPHDGKNLWYDTYEVDLMKEETPKRK